MEESCTRELPAVSSWNRHGSIEGGTFRVFFVGVCMCMSEGEERSAPVRAVSNVFSARQRHAITHFALLGGGSCARFLMPLES